MNINIRICFVLLSLLMLNIGCKENATHPVQDEGPAPPPVNNVKVENRPGGAKITYDLPESKNLLYVKADFTISEGNKREVKSSRYDNELIVEGFPDTREYTGKLYTVSRGEKKSNPVTVAIKPLTPPVIEVANSVSVERTFGGIKINFQNEHESKVVLTVLTTDSLGDLVSAKKYYTQSSQGSFYDRGYPSVKRKFGVFIRDRWNNRSDTTFTEVVPIYEQKLDKTKFREIHLPTDTWQQHCCGGGMTDLWDGVTNDYLNTLLTPAGSMPQWFTFDLGVKVKLDRFKVFHRASGGGIVTLYRLADVKKFELWGTNDPNPDGSFDGWTKLETFESIKPSGPGPNTNEDIQYAVIDGEDFQFSDPEDAPSVRYLRFKTLETWGGQNSIYLTELTFWGSIQ